MSLNCRFFFVALLVLMVSGCKASGNYRAPLEQRNSSITSTGPEEKEVADRKAVSKRAAGKDVDAKFHVYTVQKGDTLYSIAFDNGLDYREVAEQNNIENPSAIQIGQQIRLLKHDETVSDRQQNENRAPSAPLLFARKEIPRMIKLPYSDMAVTQIEKMQMDAGATTVVASQPKVNKPQPEPIKAEHGKAATEPAMTVDENPDWALPASGKVIAEFSESANRKGIDIAGAKGQPIFASAAGKVVYSGSGLRGYGKLVIIKHNKTFLSAYAHNDQVLVKEGQSVSRGQKIAEMGNTDADQVKLHFEIRRYGKPVDPSRYVDLGKS